MDFLTILEAGRTPFLDLWFSFVTNLGAEYLLLAVAFIFYWCADKKRGLYLLCVGFCGISVNALLKEICCIPRPWVVNPRLTVVESARAGATGYSFPSGQTQLAAGLYGGLARMAKKGYLRLLLILAALLVGFSRMYLGVHTPLDVFVSLLLGAILVFVLYPAFRNADFDARPQQFALLLPLLLSAAALLYGELSPLPAGADPALSASVLADAYKVFGCSGALFLSVWLDTRFAGFHTEAPLPLQFLKASVGFVIVVALLAGLKTPLLTLFNGHHSAGLMPYFIAALTGAYLYPLTFRFLPAEETAEA